MRKPILLLIFILLIIAIWYFAGDYLSLSFIQGALDGLRASFQAHPFIFVMAFMALYIIITASSLPFATVLTLLGGAIFGFWWGLGVVSISATIGATLAFLGARYFFRDSIQQRYGNQLSSFNEGIEKDGAFYLFTLRLIPIFPFFLVNLLMGLTAIKARTYAWVSWVGMIPGTSVYVLAGKNLGQIDSLSGLLSWPIFISLTLLGVFPWIAKALINMLKARKIYKNYNKPKSFDRNLVVIGGGSAGLVGAYISASSKAKVTMIEKNKTGGDCLNYGCVPSKALIKSGRIAASMRNAESYGINAHVPQIDVKNIAARVQDAIDIITPHDSPERYRGLGVDVVMGEAKIIDPWRVAITPHEGEPYQLTTNAILLATGAVPFVPPIDGLDTIDYLTSDNLWSALATWKKLPAKLLVLGGGNIGCELSQAFAHLGVEVTLVEMADALLAREDEDVTTLMRAALEGAGVRVLTGHQAIRFSKGKCTALHQEQEVEITFDEVLVAVGRIARTQGFGLEELGVKTDRTILVDKYLRTNFPNIFAAGDAIAPYQFTPTAAYEGTYGALNALFGGLWKFKVNYDVLPYVTFTSPEIARVGINEKQAKAAGVAYEITEYPIAKLDRAITENAREGFVKILTKKGSDKILGVTIASEHAGEIIAEFTLAMKKKIGLRTILGTTHAYPTWSEASKNASGIWSNAHLNEKLMTIPKWYLKRRRK